MLVVANLVASVLSVNSAQDVELAQPFCDAIMIDLPSQKAMSKSRSKVSFLNPKITIVLCLMITISSGS